MNEQAKHTPTPWREHTTDGGAVYIQKHDGGLEGAIARLDFGENPEADAAFIVKACNGYEGLVEALKTAEASLQDYLDGGEFVSENVPADLKIIREALAKAEEE